MWLEYFLTISCSRQLLAYCLPSSLKWSSTVVPATARSAGSISKPVLPSLIQRQALLFAGLARDDFNLVGDHEGAVEADAELADQVRVLLGVAGELREKVLGSGAGNGAQVRDQIFLVHADAGVGDGEGLVLLVQFQVDPGIEWESLVSVIDQGQMTQLVQRVGRVGDEFAQERSRDANRASERSVAAAD
jgi:hypothetical protein